VYRDLKPENILMDEQGYIALADFGLAKIVNTGEKANSVVGTAQYLAPEIVDRIGHTMAVDWWSFGILTYLNY
jgi:serine/threonine protein kinase